MAVRQAGEFGDRFALEAHPPARVRLWLPSILMGILALGVAVPRLMPALLPAILLCLVLDGSSTARTFPAAPAVSRGFAVAFAAVALAGTWNAPSVTYAVWLTVSFGAIALTAVHLADAVGQMTHAKLSEVRRSIVFGLAAAAGYLAIEQCTGRLIIGTLYDTFPVLAGKSHYTFIFDDTGRELVRRHVLNRGTGVLTLLLWPLMLLLALEVKRGHSGRWTIAGLFVVACSAILLSAHEASKVALAVSLCAFGLALFARRAAVALLLAGWVAANVGVVPAVRMAYDSGWQMDTGLTGSARARITIWNFTATRVSSAWTFGHGIDSVRNDDNQVAPKAIAGEEGQHRTGRHSHNVFLQIWYEFGVVGSLLWTLAGLYILARVRRFKAAAQPFAIAGATAAIIILSCSWGLWQHWYAATIALTTFLFAIAAASGMTAPRSQCEGA